jgi:hypothetical protein
MKEKIQNWLHDLGVALGLIEPPLQPVPIRTDDEQRRRQPRRREVACSACGEGACPRPAAPQS